MTNREMISRVRSTHKLLGDSSLTDRAILAELNGSAKVLIKQQTDKRKLWNSSSLFTVIPCLEMEQIPLAECCDYVSSEMISKSKKKLPRISEGNFGPLIQGIFSIDGSIRLNPSSPAEYINTKKLKLDRPSFWIENDYLFVTKEVMKVKVIAFFEDALATNVFIENCNCGGNKEKVKCKSALDAEFKCPDYLQSSVTTIVSRSLLESYFRIKTDINSDAKDDQTNSK